MPDSDTTEERNPTHPKALTTSELTIGRVIVCFDPYGRHTLTVKSTPHDFSDPFEDGEAEKAEQDDLSYLTDLLGPEPKSQVIDLEDEKGNVRFYYLGDIGVAESDIIGWNTNYVLDASDVE